MLRHWSSSREASSPKPPAAPPDTVTAQQAAQERASPLALYVTGPAGGKRHLLHRGQLVTIGRAADSTIVIDDPRISRVHAALHLAEPMQVSDLESANGTYVGGERLRPSEARDLALNESVFAGDSALVVRASGLLAPEPRQIIGIEALAERWRDPPTAGTGPNARGSRGAVLLKVRGAGAVDPAWVEAMLGEVLRSPGDWIIPLGGGETAALVRAESPAEMSRLERGVLERLASWGLTAAVDAAFVAGVGLEPALQAALAFLRGGGSVVRLLERGSVILRAPAMQALHRILLRVAPAPVGILLLGETGAGKDVVASMIHELSPRASKPLVRLNCASLPEQLLESELFGHERGAFTGAVAARPGLLEAADGGTVFLDEIGDLALPLQPKLLRAIESSEVVRVGGVRPRKIDVRFVAATNHDLDQAVADGRFRRDLLHRLNCVTVTVPPLRERREEIAPLARHFLDSACARFELAALQLSEQSVAALEAHAWPGNVRELRNVVERAALMVSGEVVEPGQLGLPHLSSVPLESADAEPTPFEAPVSGERDRIAAALQRCGGNQSRAAALLGMPRRTLVRRISALNFPRPHRRP